MAEAAVPNDIIEGLVGAVGIRRVICVDDVFARDLDYLTELLAGFDPEERGRLLSRDEVEMGQEGIWQARLREEWERRSEEERAALLDDAYAIDIDVEPVRHGFLEFLTQASGITCEGLSLKDWSEKRDEIVAALDATPTLILFDQDFEHEEGGATTGERLIADLEDELKTTPTGADAYYGLLTNTVSTTDEHARRNEILAKTDIDPTRLVVISKQNMQDESRRIAERLRTTLLAPVFSQLVQAVSMNVSLAQEDALELASEISPEDLEHMVVRLSEREGVWAPDTLLRVLEILQRASVREALRTDQVVRDRVEQLQALAEVGFSESRSKEADAGVPVAVYVAHQEIYEPAEHINGLHLPIELGDVFKKGKQSLYVVVAQPCTLMVRTGGKRKPEPSHVLLAEIGSSRKGDPREVSLFELPYFDLGSGDHRFVKLGRPVMVRTLVLDACVFNADGMSRLDFKAPLPQELLPHWRQRRAYLHGKAKKIFLKAEKLPQGSGKDIQKGIAGSFEADPFTLKEISVQEEVIEWDCTRVMRIIDPYARALLTRFSQYLSRDAYLHDLARQ
jgi:hypothetical protein